MINLYGQDDLENGGVGVRWGVRIAKISLEHQSESSRNCFGLCEIFKPHVFKMFVFAETQKSRIASLNQHCLNGGLIGG